MTVYLLTEAVQAAKALLPHMSKDDSLNLITHVHLRDGYMWEASDRYSLGAVSLTPAPAPFNEATEDTTDLLLPRAAVEYLAKLNVKTLRFGKNVVWSGGYRVELTASTVEPRSVTIRLFVQTGESPEDVPLEDSSRTFDTIEGDYPPIHKLLTDAKERSNSADPMCYAPDKLERLSASAKAFGTGKNAPQIWLKPSGDKAMVAQIGSNMEVLIMPLHNPEPPEYFNN